MSTLARSILDFLLPAIEAHKLRRWNSAPETTIYPDDRWMDWAERLIEVNEDACREFILKATIENMTELFAALTDDLWPAHRRAFASKLHTFAMELEAGGLDVSKGFADFFRERYNPLHKFHSELPVLPAGSVVVSSEEEETPCSGCAQGLANQQGHMSAGGCLAPVKEEDEA